ncbi:MAG: phenylalanine--tRNA ligase subunit beta [bacterium]
MVFSYNWLQSYFTKKLPNPEKLAQLLVLHSFEVEEVKKKGKDYTLDIDVLPNRAADCFSHYGIAKECAAILNIPLKERDAKVKEDKKIKTSDFISVDVKNKAACPRYSTRVVSGVKIGLSPVWLKEKLVSCGLRPINNVVDIANYVMLDVGQPLHAFDGDKLDGKKIIVRHAKDKERMVTLDDQKFELDSDILVIADNKRPVAIAGIKGGKSPEIDNKTKTIVLEAANFDSVAIRKASKKINLRTDASLRFEHGIDPNLTEIALNQSAILIQKIAGGKIAKGLVDIYSKKILSKLIKLDLACVRNVLGINISEKEIKSILEKLDFKIAKKGKYFFVTVPTKRKDVLIPEDLIEEVGRIYGYDKIKASFPVSNIVPPTKNLDIFWEEMTKDIMKGLGFTEVYNYSFFGDKEAKLVSFKNKDLIEVQNPLSVEQKYLRASLIPNLLKNVEKNIKNSTNIKIFELGKIFVPDKKEKRMISGLIFGDSFYRLKGIVDTLLNRLAVSDIWYDEHKATPEESKLVVWHSKKCAEIKVGKEEIGFLGEVSPKILSELEVKETLVLFDINFDKLSRLVSEEHEYRPISRYPAAIRDIAILVPRKVKVADVLNVINTTGGLLVRDVDLFDMYEGEELPQGKKNLAFHIIYQSETKTLKSNEVEIIQQKIIKALEKNQDWQARK